MKWHQRLLRWVVRKSGGRASFPQPIPNTPSPDGTTIAGRLDAMCAKYGATYERHRAHESQVTLLFTLADGTRFVGTGQTTALACADLESKVGKWDTA